LATQSSGGLQCHLKVRMLLRWSVTSVVYKHPATRC